MSGQFEAFCQEMNQAPQSLPDTARLTSAPIDLSVARAGVLTAAYQAPGQFWRDVGPALLQAAAGVCRSEVFHSYNLFHEFGERHATAQKVAFLEYSLVDGFCPNTYREICQTAKRLASAWRGMGLLSGDTVMIALEVSPAYVSSILACWHCGAVVAVVPPEGPGFVRSCHVALGEGVWTVAGVRASGWVKTDLTLPWDPVEISVDITGAAELPAHVFFPTEVAARLFSPLAEDWTLPVEVCAEPLLLGSLRDAAMILGIGRDMGVSAPGACPLQVEPALLLPTLSMGAHWVGIESSELVDGGILFDGAVDLLWVEPRTRDLMLERASSPTNMPSRWIRNLGGNIHDPAWGRLEVLAMSAGAWGMNLLTNSAAAGALLFSPWARNGLGAFALQVPGLACTLTESNGSGMPAWGDVGILAPMDTGTLEETAGLPEELWPTAVGQVLLSRTSAVDLFIANVGSHRSGQVLPEQLIEAELQLAFPGEVRAAVLATLPVSARGNTAPVVLVVFTSPGSELDSNRVLNLLTRQLGSRRCPWRADIFTLNPVPADPDKPDGTVDRVECRRQFLDGTLWRKMRKEVFVELARLCAEKEQRLVAMAEQG